MNQELRYQVLNRDGHQCIECGSRHDWIIYHTSYPDIDTIDNLITLCRSCHRIIHDSITNLVLSSPYNMVRLTSKAYNGLTEIGKKNESYSDIVLRLVDFYIKRRMVGRSR